MEHAEVTSFPVGRDPSPRPAPQTAQLGQDQDPAQRTWRRWAFLAIMPLVLAGSFVGAVYVARDSPRDFGFVLVAYYFIALLYCCLVKLNHLRRDDPAAAPERGRVRIAVWAISVGLVSTIANRVADAMPNLGLKIAVWVITCVGIAVGLYFFARAEAGCQTDKALHEVSLEQRV